jgi:aryl-alcohol dehydrogenase-like predicted oxidoreductase
MAGGISVRRQLRFQDLRDHLRNWLTHGSQVENDQATACVRAALDVGITTFDTADVYANTKAETVLGEAVKGERRESLEILTKVYWPTGPRAQ